MDKLKEITVFISGDSSKISTWSNVPYFFTENLIRKGIIVNRVDLSPLRAIDALYQKTFCRLWKKISKESLWDYSHTFMHYLYVRHKIKQAQRKYKNSQANIFMATYGFSSAGISDKPAVILGDWTFEYNLEYFYERKPDFLERFSVRKEKKSIHTADLVISLFPGSTEMMRNHSSNPHIYYLGNVVNTLEKVDKDSTAALKKESSDLLFIGRSKYIEGARSLLSAFDTLKKERPDARLHIVGIQKELFDFCPPDTYFYGYLDKGNPEERKVYYDLLKKAKIFVNTTPKWGTFSACVEAMYFCTPVLVCPYAEFVNTFGKEINMGLFCPDNEPEQIAGCLNKLLGMPDYEEMASNAHEAVAGFMWEEYVTRFIELLENKLN